jgi:hypothetical protein
MEEDVKVLLTVWTLRNSKFGAARGRLRPIREVFSNAHTIRNNPTNDHSGTRGWDLFVAGQNLENWDLESFTARGFRVASWCRYGSRGAFHRFPFRQQRDAYFVSTGTLRAQKQQITSVRAPFSLPNPGLRVLNTRPWLPLGREPPGTFGGRANPEQKMGRYPFYFEWLGSLIRSRIGWEERRDHVGLTQEAAAASLGLITDANML